MEDLLKMLHAYSRQLELEDSVSDWENRSAELKARTSEMTENLQKKELALEGVEASAFLQKFFGKKKAEKEKLIRQIREITSARTAAQWELEATEKKIAAGKLELQALSGSGDAYKAAKADAVFSSGQASCLMMEEISAFVPAARKAADRVLETLETMQLWQIQEDEEYLSNAESAAKRLRNILSVLPEGVAPIGSFLLAPGGFLKDTNGLILAKEQIQQVIHQLRLLMGE